MVARETSPSSPSAGTPGEALRAGLAALGLDVPEDAASRLEAYTGILLQEAIPQGFLGPNEADRILERHILESAALAPVLPGRTGVTDVGSGAGLPGIVLGCVGRRVTIIEGLEKRARFLHDVAQRLGVTVDVRFERAEDAGRGDLRGSADAVVARALAEPAVALELCLPLARVGGLVAIPATRRPEEDERFARVATALGGGAPRWEKLSVPGVDPPRYVMIVDKTRPTAERFPRRSGVPKRRPLG